MTAIQTLKTFLTAPVSECKFSQLKTALRAPNIRPDITFWGQRVITVEGEEGSVSLHALADKVVLIIRARCLSPTDWPSNMTPDKIEAKIVVNHLDHYYSQTDTLIARANNYFTRFLAKIREFVTAATRVHADIEYLRHCGFKIGYKIPHWDWFWGHDPVPDWAVDDKSTEELEFLLTCPLSLGEVVDPVIDKCGHTFEREKIKKWLQKNNTCPFSRERITRGDLIQNRIVKQAIDILNKRGRGEDGTIQTVDEEERGIVLWAEEQLCHIEK